MGRNGPRPDSPQWHAERAYWKSWKGKLHSLFVVLVLVGGPCVVAKGCTIMARDIEKAFSK